LASSCPLAIVSTFSSSFGTPVLLSHYLSSIYLLFPFLTAKVKIHKHEESRHRFSDKETAELQSTLLSWFDQVLLRFSSHSGSILLYFYA